ncbi:TPA: hypothetical protein HA235_00925 [Candidatus Woesearchaeota archaeon]|nr:hypothetical protein [Candidatus Woesearchaeota archaeon]HIH31248.1 hypothetical protein [Candidatus Woesearchaeota archaeon]HIH54868.1 hypothetical protein [Candidatus Woesearchaeota archaeon]HIJ01929.1 hypothetical protein [Candidatus Woesearchaeota archaeon]HIJ13537.1 hypothetical protein [Candidatus Woesearchaeota archaeon]
MIQVLDEIDKSLSEKKIYLEGLFEITIDKIFVSILSKEEFSKLDKSSWVVGFAFPRENIIFVVDQKSSERSYDEWLKVIIHEMVHLFYFKKFKTSQPKWFFEGLACYLADQKKKESEIELKDLIKYFPDDINDTEIYNKGYNIIKKLLK